MAVTVIVIDDAVIVRAAAVAAAAAARIIVVVVGIVVRGAKREGIVVIGALIPVAIGLSGQNLPPLRWRSWRRLLSARIIRIELL